jgi:adenylate cyclase
VKAQATKTVRYPIGFKLMFIITGLLALALGAITVLVSTLVSIDVRVTAENTNFQVNAQAAQAAESVLSVNRSAVLTLLRSLRAVEMESRRHVLLDYFFSENSEFAALTADGQTFINSGFFRVHETSSDPVYSYLDSRNDYLARAEAGETIIINASDVFKSPMLVMILPVSRSLPSQAAAVFFSSEKLAQIFGENVNLSYMVNGDGDILIHPDQSLVLEAVSYRDDPFIKFTRARGEKQLQNLYTDSAGHRHFGAYTKLPTANLAVITTIGYDIVFEGIAATTTRNIWLSAGVLCISMLCVWFFSKTISDPLKNLSAAAGRVKNGEFNIALQSKNRDEIGLLTSSFVEMSRGLAERERLKDTFGRFINREIAEQALKGRLELGGETKQVTVFFSDLRNFTSIAENMSPQDVVGFLNSYLSRMVKCVTKTGGVVDKFIGDAIMAIWGSPVSSGNVARDALSCIRSALMMRVALTEYNQSRGSNNRPYLTIGCGINTGDVVAGQIGSTERMEYTVIGDTVNLASRTEALNKPFNTDILITENTWNLVKDFIIAEEMPNVSIKGKEKPIRMFAVINRRVRGDRRVKPATLAELRQHLGLPAPDLSSTDVQAVEKKYKLHD